MKLNRIISITTLAVALIALFLVLKRPQPVAPPQSPEAAAANAQSFQNKLTQIEQAPQPTSSPDAGAAPAPAPEVHITSQEVSAAIAQAAGALPAAATGQSVSMPVDSAGQPNIKDYNVSFEGDQVHGQFLTQVAGKDVWVTVSGHLNSKDGYAQFDPTEFKVGDLNVPVSLVNDALQKRLAEQHDRLKLPDSVGGLKVENGELVVTPK